MYEQEMKIKGKLVKESDYMSPVTYIPAHAKGNASHEDCKLGVLIGASKYGARVLYCDSRTVQLTNFENLVWG
jgi:hypothetical protein